jgi:hypothetical protein
MANKINRVGKQGGGTGPKYGVGVTNTLRPLYLVKTKGVFYA